jgi:hypothetical protein
VPGREVSAWLTALGNTLPASDGAITLDGSDVEVTVRWDDSRGVEGPLTFTTVVEL